MDATTNKKTLAVALVALLVGSLLVSGFASAHVEGDTNSSVARTGVDEPDTAVANAILHYDSTEPDALVTDCDANAAGTQDNSPGGCDDDADSNFWVDLPSAGELLYGRTYDLFFVAIPSTETDEGNTVRIYFEGTSWRACALGGLDFNGDGDCVDVAVDEGQGTDPDELSRQCQTGGPGTDYDGDGDCNDIVDETDHPAFSGNCASCEEVEVDDSEVELDFDPEHCIAAGGVQYGEDDDCVNVIVDSDGDGTIVDAANDIVSIAATTQAACTGAGGVWDTSPETTEKTAECDLDATSCANLVDGDWDGVDSNCDNVDVTEAICDTDVSQWVDVGDDEGCIVDNGEIAGTCISADDQAFFSNEGADEEDFCTDLFYVYAIVFDDVTFEWGAGTYYLWDDDENELIGSTGEFIVNATETLEMVIEPAEWVYTYGEEVDFDVSLTNEGDGVEDVVLESDEFTEATDDETSGSGAASLEFESRCANYVDNDCDAPNERFTAPPAGTWRLAGSSDVTVLDEIEDDDNEADDEDIGAEADITGEAELEILANGLVVTEDSVDNMVSGFRQSATWWLQYPEEAEADDENCDFCSPTDEAEGDEGLNLVFPGEEPADDVEDEITGENGLLYQRMFEIANVTVTAPNGDEYFVNLTWEEWDDLTTWEPFWLCSDATEDFGDAELEDQCAEDTDDDGDVWDDLGDAAFDAPLLFMLEDDGRLSIMPNEDFVNPDDTASCADDEGFFDCNDPGEVENEGYLTALSEDSRFWQTGTYNVTIEVSTSGRGEIEHSYDLFFVDSDLTDEEVYEAADFPEYRGYFEFQPAEAADINMVIEIDTDDSNIVDDAGCLDVGNTETDFDDDCDFSGFEESDSIDVQKAYEGADFGDFGILPTQAVLVTLYGETLDDHPLCDSDLYEGEDNDPATTVDESTNEACLVPNINDLLDSDVEDQDEVDTDAFMDAIDDFIDSVEITGEVLPGWEIVGYNPLNGVMLITGITPTGNGTIDITVTLDGESATHSLETEDGANITLDSDEIEVGTDNTIIATVRDVTGGLATTADLALLFYEGDDAGNIPSSDAFDLTPASGEISGNGQSGRGAGGEYRFVVNPDTTEDLVVFTQVGDDADATYAYALLQVAPAHDLDTELVSSADTMASVMTAVVLEATVGDESLESGDLSVYLLNESGLADFEEDGGSVLADILDDEDGEFLQSVIEIDQADIDQDESMVYFNVTLPPGVWSILVCDEDCAEFEAQHDNADSMPTITSHMFRATFTPDSIANDADVQKNVRVTVRVTDHEGRPANGTLTSITRDDDAHDGAFDDESDGETTNEPIVAAIANGVGTFSSVTGDRTGAIAFVFNPAGSSEDPDESLVDGVFNIIGPNMTITPPSVRLGQVTLVEIVVRNLNATGLVARNVAVCAPGVDQFPSDLDEIEDLEDAADDGPDFDIDGDTTISDEDDFEDFLQDACAFGTTGADGAVTLALTPTSTNPYRVYVNNSYTGRDIPVLVGALVLTLNPAAPELGDTVTATVSLAGSNTGNSAGVSMVVTRDGRQLINQLTNAAGQVNISNVQIGNYTVTASRTGFGNATARFTVGAAPPVVCMLELEDLTIPTTVNVGTRVNITATVVNDCDENMTERATLLVNTREVESRNITVEAGNETELSYNFTPTVSGSYAIVIRLGDVNTTRTINVGLTGNVTTPTVNVTASPPVNATTPPTGVTTTTPPVSPTGGTPTTTSPRVPGFEVVALIAALGVALLVLRRRS